MAIKIDNKDLSKRIINGQEVQKVILNGAEIRPNEVPHIDYHVISDFTSGGGGGGGGGLTGGWEGSGYSSSSASGIYSSNGSTVSIYYTGMPSLANAKRIEIIHKVNRNKSYDLNYIALGGYFKRTSTTSLVDFLIRFNAGTTNPSWYEQLSQINISQSYRITNTPTGDMVVKYWVDFEQVTESHPYGWFGVDIMSTDLSTAYDSNTWFLIEDAYNLIKNADFYQINIGGDMKVKKVDFYIYNN